VFNLPGDVIGFMIDLDNDMATIYKNRHSIVVTAAPGVVVGISPLVRSTPPPILLPPFRIIAYQLLVALR
jgi:hypothetical protein